MIISVPIPKDGSVLVKRGQSVDFGAPFLRIKNTSDVTIPLARKLDIAPNKIFRYLKKFVGEGIRKGDVLAVKNTIFAANTVVSDYDGVIKEINHFEGNIIMIKNEDTNSKVDAYFKGDVYEITEREIKIKVEDALKISLKKITYSFGGKTSYAKNHSSSSLTALSVFDKVFIDESVSEYLLAKLEALGIKAVVSLTKLSQRTSFPYAQVAKIEDFKNILDRAYPYCMAQKEYSTIYFYR